MIKIIRDALIQCDSEMNVEFPTSELLRIVQNESGQPLAILDELNKDHAFDYRSAIFDLLIFH